MRRIIALVLVFYPCHCFSQSNDSVSLVDFSERSSLKFEEGVTGFEVYLEGKPHLKVQTQAAPTKGPAVYFATVMVEPGEVYTYFVKGLRRSSCRVLHYVTTPKGNLVWPGADVEEGMSRTSFTVPDDIHQITLALSFLYPKEEGYVLIEDIGLFKGHLTTWAGNSESNVAPLIPPRFWVIWVFLLLMTVLMGIMGFEVWKKYRRRRLDPRKF